MALFVVGVQLQLSQQDKARFERIAVALETIAAGIADATGGVTPEQTLQLTELNATQAAKVAALRAALTEFQP